MYKIVITNNKLHENISVYVCLGSPRFNASEIYSRNEPYGPRLEIESLLPTSSLAHDEPFKGHE